MNYNFDRVIDRKNTNSYKWDCNKKYFGQEDILPFWVADMDFPCAEPIVNALKQRVDHKIYGYTVRSESYFESLVQWMRKRHQWEIKREWMAFCPPGVIQAVNMLVCALSNPGEDIVLQLPAYKPLIDVVRNNGRNLVGNPLRLKNGHYSPDFDDLIAKITPATRLLLLCSPHNPSGRVWTRDELERLGDICLKNNVTVISDEIYADFVFKTYKHIPFGSLSEKIAQHSITCISAGKTFNVSGLPQATLFIPNPRLRTIFTQRIDTAQVNLGNIFGEVALEAAYGLCEDWLDQVIDYVEENLSYLIRFLKERLPAVRVIRPQGTFLVWLDFRKLNMPVEDINHRLIHRAKIALYDGREFGEEGEGFFRFNLACPRALLNEALNRLESAFPKE